MKWLGIETSSSVCSVGLYLDSGLLALIELFQERRHIEKLAVFIDELFAHTRTQSKELKAVAVSEGPGSYTGLRIGVSTAKGICFSLDIPMLALSTPMIVAEQARSWAAQHPGQVGICAVINAGKNYTYSQYFTSDVVPQGPCERHPIQFKSFEKQLDTQKIIFVGNASKICSRVIQHKNALFMDQNTSLMHSFGALGNAKIRSQQFVDIHHFEPIYAFPSSGHYA